jgi:hypothetical protein
MIDNETEGLYRTRRPLPANTKAQRTRTAETAMIPKKSAEAVRGHAAVWTQ